MKKKSKVSARAKSRSIAARPMKTKRRGAPISGRVKWEKRTPREIDVLEARLFVYVKKHPGENIERIANGLAPLRTKDLALPMKRLRAKRVVKARGVKRGTLYFAK